ncbi:MAG: ABC transporter substrate-binding protein [Deltaproteobacteria bacterium]|nr:ABC transporter substrate-binding protein [Deltaproteobacteria bacterium]
MSMARARSWSRLPWLLLLAATPVLAMPPHGRSPGPPAGQAGAAPPGDPGEPIPGVSPQPTAAPAPSPTPPPKPTAPIRIGITTWIAHAPGFVAAGGLSTVKGSLLDKAGVDVKFVVNDDPAAAKAAFGRGELDLVTTTLDAFATEGPTWGGAPAHIILLESYSRGADGVVVAAEIGGAEDLALKKVTVIDSSATRFLLNYVLDAAGLSGSQRPEVALVADGATAKDDFRKGGVQGAVVWEPYLGEAVAERGGARRLLTTTQASGLIADVLIVRDDVLARDAERLGKLVAAWYAAANDVRVNAKAALPKIATALALEPADVTSMMNNVALASREDMLALGDPVGGKAGRTRFERLAAAAARLLGRGKPPELNLINYDLARAAKAIPVKKAKLTLPVTSRHLLRFGRSLRFTAGADVLDPTSDATLDALGELLTFIPVARVRVEPAAAGRGSLSVLGKQRATAIAKALADRFGVEAARILAPAPRPAPVGAAAPEDTVWISVEL